MNMVQDKTTASGIWEELRKTYQLKGYSARHIVWNRLMRSELSQFSSISEYGENMKKGMIELNSLSEAPYQEWQVTSIFLHGLGSEWDPIVSSIIYSIQEQARNKSSPTSESGTRSTIVDEPSFHEVLHGCWTTRDVKVRMKDKTPPKPCQPGSPTEMGKRSRAKGRKDTVPVVAEMDTPTKGVTPCTLKRLPNGLRTRPRPITWLCKSRR